MQWLNILLCVYDGFYGNYSYNGFYVDCFIQNYYQFEKSLLRFISLFF